MVDLPPSSLCSGGKGSRRPPPATKLLRLFPPQHPPTLYIPPPLRYYTTPRTTSDRPATCSPPLWAHHPQKRARGVSFRLACALACRPPSPSPSPPPAVPPCAVSFFVIRQQSTPCPPPLLFFFRPGPLPPRRDFFFFCQTSLVFPPTPLGVCCVSAAFCTHPSRRAAHTHHPFSCFPWRPLPEHSPPCVEKGGGWGNAAERWDTPPTPPPR